ncbi:DedA family protein [Kitasatospora sp. GAS204B]|uniref:DedA family protein n=1 Tax=unclassified Kitasatospora TaxID=2633591 RepID=UPI002476919F|nr:DedA family protein [Kitasatospora sp. GAS204B]MDH6120362.1 membrane-associated protein [Kitasatospora sp. GAS204B]
MTSALNLTNGSSLLAAYGALAVLLVTFVEAGFLVVGFFVPGDTLLFPAGVLCASAPTAAEHHGPYLTLWQVLLCAAVGAIAGAQLGFMIGRHGGQALLSRSRSTRLKRTAVRSEELLERYGQRKAIVLGRFIPLVRSVLAPLAGALRVPVRTFTLWQVVGGLLWTQTTILAGYALGSSVPGIDNYLLPVVLGLVVLSALPLLFTRRKNDASTRPDR